jgi:hypothetical protein
MADKTEKPKLEIVTEHDEPASIAKPDAFDLNQFKSTRAPRCPGMRVQPEECRR